MVLYLRSQTVSSSIGSAWIQICGHFLVMQVSLRILTFTTVNNEFRGRFRYGLSAYQWSWTVWTGSSSSSVKMILHSSGLYVGGTLVSASDKRLKFNENPLVNAMNVINRLEPVEYDQTYDLVDTFTLTKRSNVPYQAWFHIGQDSSLYLMWGARPSQWYVWAPSI